MKNWLIAVQTPAFWWWKQIDRLSLSPCLVIVFKTEFGFLLFYCWPCRKWYCLLMPHSLPHQIRGSSSHSWKISSFRITESLKLRRTTEAIYSNWQPIPTMCTKPCPSVLSLRALNTTRRKEPHPDKNRKVIHWEKPKMVCICWGGQSPVHSHKSSTGHLSLPRGTWAMEQAMGPGREEWASCLGPSTLF